MTEDQIVEVGIGYDSFRAELIRGVCEAEEIQVRLISNTDNGGVGLSSMSENRLMVRRSDVDEVRAIVEELDADTA